MESFSPGRSHQTERRWKRSNGEGDPRFWLSGARSPPRPCLLEMWDRKRGDNKTSHMEIRNYYQSWSDISLVGLSLQPLPAGFPLSCFSSDKSQPQMRLIPAPFPSSGMQLAVPERAFC